MEGEVIAGPFQNHGGRKARNGELIARSTPNAGPRNHFPANSIRVVAGAEHPLPCR